MIAVRLLIVMAHFLKALGILVPFFSREIFLACRTDGIKTGLALFFQRIAAPVQVGHAGTIIETVRAKKDRGFRAQAHQIMPMPDSVTLPSSR
jgi:hypothetical protein